MGDTLVVSGSLVTPSSASSGTTGTVVINGNTYLTNGSASSTVLPSYADDSTGALKDTLNVGDVVQIDLQLRALSAAAPRSSVVDAAGLNSPALP